MQDTTTIQQWTEKFPELEPIIQLQPSFWLNPELKNLNDSPKVSLSFSDMEAAKAFMEKYSSYIAQAFPETASFGGKITSELREIPHFKKQRLSKNHPADQSKFFMKCDNALPVAGSIKARGGFYEVLRFAHQLAVQHELIKENETADFSEPIYKNLFSKYTIGVGSTGNLGLSIGIISAKLGFKVNVYMSQDAKAWKKALLREKGAHVIEEKGDFGIAIAKGRKETTDNPLGYFVDDEKSQALFLGYSLAAYEIKDQLDQRNILIDKEHPLFVYSPCGVGGSPGGVMWGLKNIYGDAFHSFFVEPTHSPAVLIGLITGALEHISVQDLGIDNRTEADGLAVGRASAFASKYIQKLVSGMYTIQDKTLKQLLSELYRTENIFIEPSATAGLIGPEKVATSGYLSQHNIQPNNITHIAWATGGGLLPEAYKQDFLSTEVKLI